MVIQDLLSSRDSLYGSFMRQSETAQALKQMLFERCDPSRMSADQAEAINMICVKLSRIVNGDPNYVDSWVDIAGYAQLVVNRLQAPALETAQKSWRDPI